MKSNYALVALALAGCSGGSSSSSNVLPVIPTSAPLAGHATATPVVTATPIVTLSPRPSSVPTGMPTSVAPSASPTIFYTPSATPSSAPTLSAPAPVATPTITPLMSPTPTSKPATPAPTATPTLPPIVVTPAPTPMPIANTGTYLPFNAGTIWEFSDNSIISDAGPVNLYGLSLEEFDFYSTNLTYLGSYYMSKGSWPLASYFAVASDNLTNLAAVSVPDGTVSFLGASGLVAYDASNFSPAAVFPGIPLTDDTPSLGEIFYLSTSTTNYSAYACICGTAGTSVPVQNAIETNDVAFTATNLSQTYPYYGNPIATINGIETTVVDALEGDALAFSFAPGYGFTEISTGSTTIYLDTLYPASMTTARKIKLHREAVRLHLGKVRPRDVLRKM